MKGRLSGECERRGVEQAGKRARNDGGRKGGREGKRRGSIPIKIKLNAV